MNPQQISVNPKYTALIVIDMQNDFCHPDGVYGKAKEQLSTIGLKPELIGQIIPKVAELLEVAREVGLSVVHTKVERDPEVDKIDRIHSILPGTFAAMTTTTSGPPLVPGSWGADFVDGLKPLPDEYVLTKRGNSAFYMTDLELRLRRKGTRTVIIAGTVLYACVLHTAFDAFNRDFDVIITEDAVATWAPELKDPTFRIVDLLLGTVRPTREIIQLIRTGK